MSTINLKISNKNIFGFDSSIFTTNELIDENGYINESLSGEVLEKSSKRLLENVSHLKECQGYVEKQLVDKEIDSDEVRDILNDKMDIRGDFFITKEKYILVDKNNMIDFLYKNPVSKGNYDYPSNDCDDFAFRLFGDIKRWDNELCVFWIRSQDDSEYMRHLHLGMLDTNKDLYMIKQYYNGIASIDNFWWDFDWVVEMMM